MCFATLVFLTKGDEAEQCSHGIIQSLYTSSQKKRERRQKGAKNKKTHSPYMTSMQGSTQQVCQCPNFSSEFGWFFLVCFFFFLFYKTHGKYENGIIHNKINRL